MNHQVDIRNLSRAMKLYLKKAYIFHWHEYKDRLEIEVFYRERNTTYYVCFDLPPDMSYPETLVFLQQTIPAKRVTRT